MRERCDAQDKAQQERGAVTKCLVEAYEDLPVSCQKVGGHELEMFHPMAGWLAV